MKLMRKSKFAFSLIEVVLALGVASFALLAIFGLFTASLQSNTEVINQDEALGLTKALPGFLQYQIQKLNTTANPVTNSFSTVYGWVQNPVTLTTTSNGTVTYNAPFFYYYTLPAVSGNDSGTATAVIRYGNATVTDGLSPALGTDISNRQGRLFGLYFTISPNYPIFPNTATLINNPQTSSLTGVTAAQYVSGTSAQNIPGNPSLAIQVQAYPVPAYNVAPAPGARPVLTYDVIVPCF